MPCFHPLTGYRTRVCNPVTGKRSITFKKSEGFLDLPVKVACGQCEGCRLRKSRAWAVRCVHEAQMHTNNCFITLTYRDQDLPRHNSLNKKHFQDFMKRLRYYKGHKLRYFHCGEYGEKFKRPHYHAILFGCDFPDKKLHCTTPQGKKLYTSESLEEIWGKGYCLIGDVTFESAAYVARYCMKKITGASAVTHYNTIDITTGEVFEERIPEYATMSRRPGIGNSWLQKYVGDVYPEDRVVIRGRIIETPKYYDTQMEKWYPEVMAEIRKERERYALKNAHDNTPDRLRVKEAVQKSKLLLLERSYEK